MCAMPSRPAFQVLGHVEMKTDPAAIGPGVEFRPDRPFCAGINLAAAADVVFFEGVRCGEDEGDGQPVADLGDAAVAPEADVRDEPRAGLCAARLDGHVKGRHRYDLYGIRVAFQEVPGEDGARPFAAGYCKLHDCPSRIEASTVMRLVATSSGNLKRKTVRLPLN